MILKQNISKFITYEITPGIYSHNDISNALKSFDCQAKYDNITMKTNLITDKILRFDINSFFNSLLGFKAYWDCKINKEYIRQKVTDLSTIDIIHLKADCIDGSVLNGIKKPILYSFVLNKPPGYKKFCSPETIHYKKINKTVLDNITFYLEDTNNHQVDFNGETLTFTLQVIKI